jgi:hypothetical protein
MDADDKLGEPIGRVDHLIAISLGQGTAIRG